MKAKTIYCLLIAFLAISANAQEKGPVAISPGSEEGIAMVNISCPTFSWTGMEWATGYKVVVFETNGPNVLGYEEMRTIADPILIKEIKGQALSWTPSSDKRLSSEAMYVWYVQAVDAYGMVMWSEGKVFKVEVELRLIGMEKTVRESLKEHGMSEEAIDDVLEDMKSEVREVVVWGVDAKGREGTTQDEFEIQGTEGSFNTVYGIGAGSNIEVDGLYNSFFGVMAGFETTTGDSNTFIGHAAGNLNTTGSNNTFIGYTAGNHNTTGANNTSLGYYAGYSNTTGNNNTFLGYYAGNDNTGGYGNAFLGYYAGYSNTTGNYNTFMGESAGHYNTTGYLNTSFGYQAGFFNTTGHDNVFLGHFAGYNETGSHKLYIENSSTSSPLIYGEFDNNIVAINGKLGIGTKSPAYAMELETTGTNAAFVAQRTDGATNYINATAGFGNFGTVTNHPLRLAVNSVWRMRLDSDNSLTMANGAICTAGGTWQNYSKREAKENIHDLTAQEAMDTLKGLVAVKYNYKVDKEEKHVGFIAEDVPELVASKDRNGISAMDIVAVLTKVVQEQQEMITEQQNIAQEQQKTISELQKKINELRSAEK